MNLRMEISTRNVGKEKETWKKSAQDCLLPDLFYLREKQIPIMFKYCLLTLLLLLLLLSRFSRVRLCATPWTAAHQASPSGPWDSPGKNTGVGCHFLQCMKVKSESEISRG